MKLFRTLLYLSFVLIVSACIKSEEPNAEADITACTVREPDILKTAPIVNNDEIGKYSVMIMVHKHADITKITPEFTLTPGATIEPASGITQDFTNPITYTVTSEDKNWKKNYIISAIRTDLPTKYSFETLSSDDGKGKYHTFIEVFKGQEVLRWASGNSGYSLTGMPKTAEDFPTVQVAQGYTNNCAKLTTRDTGFFGSLNKMPIAAGNLFLGQFNVLEAVGKPLEATKFGLPFNQKPLQLKGWYQYTPGETYKDHGKPVAGKIDEADIYGVFYETDDNLETLDGSNSLTHPNIIAIAREDLPATTKNMWTEFNFNFKYKEGKTIDPQKLKDGKYKIAIVFTSSKDGAHFSGAIGSTLYVDEVELIAEEY